MERLTKRDFSRITYNERRSIMCSSYCDNCSKGTGDCNTMKKMINRLAELEDLEEQGLLVRLPCKVGDLVFIIDGENICRRKVKSIKILSTAIEISTSDIIFHKESFGETVFLTREETEKKLEEMKNDKA